MPETLSPPEELLAAEREHSENDVNFEKCQMDRVLEAPNSGRLVEYEAFSPYLRDNNTDNAALNNELRPEDQTGMEVLKMLNAELPDAQAVSLYDEYNTTPGQTKPFSDDQRETFLKSIRERVVAEGGRIDHFISESSKVEAAGTLVDKLKNLTRPDGRPYIKEKGDAIYFNDGESTGGQDDEHFFPLRSKGGRWMCEALDASSFLDPQNTDITHLVVLPERFKIQQERVWNMLNTLGIQPDNYHNIFFDPEADPAEVVQKIKTEIDKARNI